MKQRNDEDEEEDGERKEGEEVREAPDGMKLNLGVVSEQRGAGGTVAAGVTMSGCRVEIRCREECLQYQTTSHRVSVVTRMYYS